jgi:putative PIN family toxin of toxin-antitoxin system
MDTNVLVSGLLSAHGAPARIMDLILLEQLVCVLDDRIYAEYAEVLRRPRFRQAVSDSEREAILSFLRLRSVHVTAPPLPGPPSSVPDPDDLPFAEAAVAGRAEALITGNTRHFDFFRDNAWGIKVLSPAEAMTQLDV